MIRLSNIAAVLFFALGTVGNAADATIPGRVTTPFPTIENLAVEWSIEGDDNLNATCAVRFREVGSKDWRTGFPLRRVPAGTNTTARPPQSWANRFSGSLFHLKPDTEYQIALKLSDPDGGNANRLINARTRAEPIAPPDTRNRHGGRKDLNDVQPGTVMLLADGDYGSVTLHRDGRPGEPIVYRSESGKAVFDEVMMNGRSWVYLEGVTVNGPVQMRDTNDCVVRGCTINSQYGIKAYKPGTQNSCIEDNTITGVRDWDADIMGNRGANEGEGIQITGSGNVIRYNRVQGFRDCLSHMEDDSIVTQMCNDWHNNDVIAGLDDGIEADFALSNCRVYQNRITNCFVGISSQPGLGGPNYFMRNVMYNITYYPFKLHRGTIGDVILHNTVVKQGDGLNGYSKRPFDRAVFRNNIFIGGRITRQMYGGYSLGDGHAVNLLKFGKYVSLDYNAYGCHETTFEARLNGERFDDLPFGGFETHGVEVGLTVFQSPAYPEEPLVLYEAPDLRPRRDSKVVDAGQNLSGVNDDFTGDAPDIGAYELGSDMPQYGPRG